MWPLSPSQKARFAMSPFFYALTAFECAPAHCCRHLRGNGRTKPSSLSTCTSPISAFSWTTTTRQVHDPAQVPARPGVPAIWPATGVKRQSGCPWPWRTCPEPDRRSADSRPRTLQTTRRRPSYQDASDCASGPPVSLNTPRHPKVPDCLAFGAAAISYPQLSTDVYAKVGRRLPRHEVRFLPAPKGDSPLPAVESGIRQSRGWCSAW
jgi:hypothetical protein